MGELFNSSAERLLQISIDGDVVSLNGIEKKKNELKNLVLAKLAPETELPDEVENKLLAYVRRAIE
jgi:hypothetical protein